MGVLILILIVLVVGVIIYKVIKQHFINREVLDNFNNKNTIVVGPQGTGKDLLFQWVIYRNKKEYYSNLNYGYKLEKIIKPIQLNLYPNTYKNFINGDITLIPKEFEEDRHFFISDAGLYFPSHMDTQLKTLYPSLPVFYPLTRQMFNSHVHMNVQAFNRLWIVIREQGDYFIKCISSKRFLFRWMKVKFYTYDKKESLELGLRPIKKRLNKDSKVNYDDYVAKNGEIHQYSIYIKIKDIKYDTRAFHKKIFGVVAPSEKDKKKLRKLKKKKESRH